MRKGGANNGILFDILSETLGKEHVTVIERLSKPKQDDELAEELDIKATIVRTLLNNLHAKSLVEYERTKNKKTGWYTYVWKVREDKLEDYKKSYLEKKLNKLTSDFGSEMGLVTFNCSCSRVSFETAFENNFLCPKCNEKFEEFNNKKLLSQLKTEIAKINSLLKSK